MTDEPGEHAALEPRGSDVAPRIGDRERQRALDVLRAACSAGKLSLDEFSERAAQALSAVSQLELDAIVRDVGDGTPPDLRIQGGLRWTVAVFASNRRRVRWRLNRRAHAVAVGGACTLDLRQAIIDGDEVLITAVGVLGAIKVIVPEGIGVELTGVSIFGAKTDGTVDDALLPMAPVVRVRGFAVFGSVRVLTTTERPMTHEQRQLRDDIVRKNLGLPLRELPQSDG